jgi:serine/threonine protein kinase
MLNLANVPGRPKRPNGEAPVSSPQTQAFASLAPGAGMGRLANQQLHPGNGYQLLTYIDRGQFGEVWRAQAPGGIEVAIKIITRPLADKDVQRELRALEVLKGLRHTFLLQTQAYWSQQDRLFIVLELADSNLRDRLVQCQKQGLPGIPPDELLKYFCEAAEALDYLHGRHIQHRDIKPANLLLVQGHIKVADFGLARMQELWQTVTTSGSGTPAYMAPEIWRGKVSPHSDQYSLALTYAELRVGRRPFSGRQLPEIMLGHLEGTPDLSPLSAVEQQVLLKALAKEPEERYPNCLAWARALEAAVPREGAAVEVRPDLIKSALPPCDESQPGIVQRSLRTLVGVAGRTVQRLAPIRRRLITAPDDHASPPGPPSIIEDTSDLSGPAGDSAAQTLILVALFFFLASLGLMGWHYCTSGWRLGTPSFSLATRPTTIELRAGEETNLTILIKRSHCDDLIDLTIEDLPPGVLSLPGLSTESDQVTVSLRADANAIRDRQMVTVRGTAGVNQATATFSLMVK